MLHPPGRLSGGALLEKREKCGTPFFFSTNLSSAAYTDAHGGHPPGGVGDINLSIGAVTPGPLVTTALGEVPTINDALELGARRFRPNDGASI
jgi:hypothetical protein